METFFKSDDSGNVLTLNGRLDAQASVELAHQLNGLEANVTNPLIIDCERLAYIGSAGLRVILSEAKRIQDKGGSIIVCSLSANVEQIFDISGFSNIFPVFETLAAAKASLKA